MFVLEVFGHATVGDKTTVVSQWMPIVLQEFEQLFTRAEAWILFQVFPKLEQLCERQAFTLKLNDSKYFTEV